MKDNTKEKLKQWLGEDNQIGMDIWDMKIANLKKTQQQSQLVQSVVNHSCFFKIFCRIL